MTEIKLACVVEKHFTADERYCPDFERAASPPAWSVSEWHKRSFDPKAGKLEGWLRKESVPVPDFLTIGFRPVVCDKFREMVEAFEPQKHQFLPVTIYDHNRHPIEKKYWALNVRQALDAIIPEKSNVTEKPAPQNYREETGVSRMFWTRGTPKLTISKNTVEGCHLWLSWELQNYFFFSDELMSAVQSQHLAKLDMVRVEEQ